MSKLIVAAIRAEINIHACGDAEMVAPHAICHWYGPSDSPGMLEIGLTADEWRAFRELGLNIAKRVVSQVETP